MDLDEVQLLLCHKSYTGTPGISHFGLGIAAINTRKVLAKNGVNVQHIGFAEQNQLLRWLQNNPATTHVVVSAPWMDAQFLSYLSEQFYKTSFAVTCHSNIGFLQAEPGAITLMRQYMEVEGVLPNFHLAGNSKLFCNDVLDMYNAPCSWLPNLYYLDNTSGIQRPGWPQSGGVIDVGMFGAARVQKEFPMGASAVVAMSRELNAQVNLWVNTGRNDNGDAKRIWNVLSALTSNIPGVTLKQVPWAPWLQFRSVVESMDLLWQPSSSETFNMVTADGASRCIPTVVTDAIEWAPPEWKAPVDNRALQTRTGIALLYDPTAGMRGYRALEAHNETGLDAWLDFLVYDEFGVSNLPYARFNQPRTLRRPKHRIAA